MDESLKNNLNKYKETKYCFLVKQTECKEDGYSNCVERIFVKEKEQEEIRFALYKHNFKGEDKVQDKKLVARPVDLTEEELFDLLEKAFQEEIFTQAFLEKLKESLSQATKAKKKPEGKGEKKGG